MVGVVFLATFGFLLNHCSKLLGTPSIEGQIANNEKSSVAFILYNQSVFAVVEQQNTAHAISLDWCSRWSGTMKMLSYPGSSSIGGQVNAPIFWYSTVQRPKDQSEVSTYFEHKG